MMTTKKKVISIISAVIVISFAVFIYIRFFFVFGEGVKAGELNQIMYKGWIWKTYEGKLIQSGITGNKANGGIQSNEFNFSVVDEEVANELMHCSGKLVELKYKEYRGKLPWRGMEKKIVYEILSVEQSSHSTYIPIIGDE